MRPVDHARALIEAHHAGVVPPREALAWAAVGLELHLHVGVNLPLALGLPGCDGGGDAAADRRMQRDQMVREVHRRWFPGLCPLRAATAITGALARQARARGRTVDDFSRALEVLAHFDPPVPGGRQLRRLLAIEVGAMAKDGR